MKCLALAVLVVLAAPSSAAAVPRFAAPGGTGTACGNDAPCGPVEAITNAALDDEVILAPGDYGSAASPITEALVSTTGVSIHGADGAPRPRIFSSAAIALDVSGAGATVRHLEVHQMAGGSNQIALSFDGDLATDIVATNRASVGVACVLLGDSVLTNSLCLATGPNGRGVYSYEAGQGGSPAGNTAVLRNVTAIATASDGTAISFVSGSGAGNAVDATVKNSIADGGSIDIEASAIGGDQTATVTVDHSNYFIESHPDGAEDIVVNGPANQRSVPIAFAAPGDYHLAPGAAPIDMGADDALNGAFDLDGSARLLGEATDMGAYEFVPPPVATTGDPGTTTASTAVVNGAVDPNRVATTYRFDYGTTTSYGAATPETDGGAGNGLAAVSATLGGLAPNTTYHYRLVAASAGGTAFGADRTLTTGRDPSVGGPLPGGPGDLIAPNFAGPIVLGIRVFAAAAQGPSAQGIATARAAGGVQRRGRQRRRAIVGTTVAFTLDEAASVLFRIERRVRGRRVGGRCVRRTRGNRTRPRCFRFALRRGSFTIPATAGRTAFRFTGRLSNRRLSRGRYRLVAVARDAAGNASAPQRVAFRIVRR